MTKTIDEQLERLASAQERSATALEGILKAIASATVTVRMPEANDDAGTDDEPATEETAVEEAQVEVAEEAEAEEQQPEPESSAADEPDDAAEAEASDAPGDDDGDPLGDGDAAVDEPELPAKLTNDTLRGFARDLMEKEGKAAVFEVLAEVGKGYKAVGEVSKEDLKEAHLKMAARLKG